MAPPTVSVVMSVFNGERFLAEAVESVINQTFCDFELIIIDDGSTDRTKEILADSAGRDHRMRVFPQANRGRADSLNRAIDLAKAPLIARMDADDISLSHRLAEQFEFMRARPEIGLLGGAVELVSPDKRRIRIWQPPAEDLEIRLVMAESHNPFFPLVMMRRELVLAAGGYRKPLRDADDYDLYLRIAERSRIANLARPILSYRIHPNQVSVRNVRHQLECVLAARAAASLRNRGAPDPLWQTKEVTPELLDTLGITAEEIQRALLGKYSHWIRLLAEVDSDLTLQFVNQLLELCHSDPAGRSMAAEALLKTASIHYRHGRVARSFYSAGRAVWSHPVEAGRLLRMGLARRLRGFLHLVTSEAQREAKDG